jgi:hypothetical protein
MNAFVRTGVAATLMLMVSTVMAQTTQEHSKHHPAGETPAAKSASPATAPTSTTNRLATMDKHMAEMKVVREKLATAKTPQERQALMAEHMKVMRAGMDMMSMGSGQTGNSAQVPQGTQGGMMGDMAQRHQLMEKRMEMMENMMRMMMDRVQ